MAGLVAAAGWDGKGIDPWLPQRIAAEIDVTAAERRIYLSWWASFSEWLVKVRRSVFASPVPDPNGVWTHVPLWAELMGQVVQGPVRDAVGITFKKLFGPAVLFDKRPAVTNYLAAVQNRMVRTPGEVFDVVASQVSRGAAAGESIPKIADRVADVLDATRTELWPGRAVTVARTETIGALNAGRSDAFTAVAEALGGDFEQQWLATIDRRTRPAHRKADLQRVPLGTPFLVGGEHLMHPGDPTGSASNVIQCVLGDTVVEFPGLRAATRRWYEGDVVKLSFASGDQLTVTPNHPILRSDGRWTPAGLLRQGDYCVSGTGLDGPLGAPDEDRGPAQIGEVYRAANQLRDAERVALAPPDLHGDGLDGEVEVVPVQGQLDVDAQPATDEQVEQLGLTLADEARARVRAAHGLAVPSQRPVGDVCCDVTGTARGVRGGGQYSPLVVVHGAHAYPVGLAGGAQRQAQRGEAAGDRGPADAQRGGHGKHALASVVSGAQVGLVDRDAAVEVHRLPRAPHLHARLGQAGVDGGGGAVEGGRERWRGLPRLVATTQLVHVERHAFAGHVFNLDTGRGWYIANGIAVRNCRCSTLLVRPGETTDMTGRGFSDADEWWASQIEESV